MHNVALVTWRECYKVVPILLQAEHARVEVPKVQWCLALCIGIELESARFRTCLNFSLDTRGSFGRRITSHVAIAELFFACLCATETSVR